MSSDDNRDMAMSIKEKLMKMSNMVSNLENKVKNKNTGDDKGGEDRKSVDRNRAGSDRLMRPSDLLDLDLGRMRRDRGPKRDNRGPMMSRRGPMMGNMGPMGPMMGDMGPMMGGMGPMMGGMGPMMGPMMGNMGPMMGDMGPMMGDMGPMMGDMGPMMGNPEMMGDNPPVRVLGELLHEQDIVEEFDDAIGNNERRIIDFVDSEARCMRTFYVGNVPTTISETLVREYFETFGVLESIDLTSKKRLEKTYFRIVTQESSTVDKIQYSRPHVIEGKEVTTKRCLLQKDKKVGYINTNTIYIGKPFSFSYKSQTGGLTMNVSEDDIFDFFRPFGEVTNVERDDSSIVGAFVTFREQDVADKVALLRGFNIRGRAVEAEKVFNDKDRDEENLPDKNESGDPEHKILRKVVVFSLPKETRAKHVKEYFSTFGDVQECFVPHKKDTGKPFAIVVFAKAQSVDDVLEARPHKIEVEDETKEVVVKRPQVRGEDRALSNSNLIKFFARTQWKEDASKIKTEVEEYFSQFGEVERVSLFERPVKRMGMVTFSDFEVAQKVSMLFLHKIMGSEVEAERAFDSKTFKEMKQMEMMQQRMMEEEMGRRRMMEDNMRMLQMRAIREMGMESGLMGIGGDMGMAEGIPPLRQDRFNMDFNRRACIVIEEVPEGLKRDMVNNHFSKFGIIQSYQFVKDEKKGYITFEEDYMTDYCARKPEQKIGDFDIKVSKGLTPALRPRGPRDWYKDDKGKDDKRKGNKRSADEMDTHDDGGKEEGGDQDEGEDEAEGSDGYNPLIDAEDF